MIPDRTGFPGKAGSTDGVAGCFPKKRQKPTLLAGIVRNRPEFYDNESGFAVPDAFAGFIGALPG